MKQSTSNNQSRKKNSLQASPGTRVVFALLMFAGLIIPTLRADDLTIIKGSSNRIAVAEGIRKMDSALFHPAPINLKLRPAEEMLS